MTRRDELDDQTRSAIADYVQRTPMVWPPMSPDQRTAAVAILARPTLRAPSTAGRRPASRTAA